MATTLAQLRTLVRQRLGLQSDDAMLTDTSLTTTINIALMKMATEFNWPWLAASQDFQTVPLQNAYTPPSRWIKTMWLKIDNNSLNSRQRIELITNDKDSGYPTDFSVWKQQLWLSPAPVNVYTVTHAYQTTETNLVADSDTILCPDWFSDIPVVYAAIVEARRQKDTGLEQQLLADKKEWIHNISKLVPEVDILPRIDSRRDFPSGH